ncbi:hypothetical protein N7495_008857 [Penicillium taxi]|uniref:uncharacterized protein n=1 Tax=Penicillium taxi TaxID=168475 RepID=UPI002545B5C4|nr:uncharacterized protein N7495_008857 [Penicillium taxi]KAJ5888816.1 hypothetical protein N7495_008857 [Penicillium taxi]
MTGADQKSFLGNISSWSTTSSSSTPQPDPLRPDVLQRSQGEDHTVTHRHRLSWRHYPSDCPPLKVRWYYAVDSPKRKPSLLEQNKAEKPLPPPKKFIRFSMKDSQSIETTFQKLSEIEDSQEEPHNQHTVSKKVPVNEDYLFDVDVEHRELSPAYWIGPVYEVRRGTWFFQDSSGMKPCEENLATQLEEGYLKLRPWRADERESEASMDEHDLPRGKPDSQRSAKAKAKAKATIAAKPRSQGAGSEAPAPAPEPQQYRLFGAYMNRIVLYQDASTAWINTDDFMSRFSTTVYQTLGGVAGTKLVRGFMEPRRPKDFDPERKPTDRTPEKKTQEAAKDLLQKIAETAREDESDIGRQQRSTLERQMSSLAGEPQNTAELEEEARLQEEQEMEDLREDDNEDQAREVDHIVLVTHGIGQRLGLRLESINFIHDVNVLRKTCKNVYKASPDLQALNSSFEDNGGNCRVQVLPVCWRHLLDFPYREVRQNRKELDLADADTLEDDAYPSLADITLESVPAVRNLISDLAMDVLLYQSGYCEHISNIVKKECNRIVQLFKKRNPSFKGSVSLCGHSLGSAILFDILCNQPRDIDFTKMADESNDIHKRQNAGRSVLNFECEEFFCLGSPIALFQMLKGKTIAGQSPLSTRGHKSPVDAELNSFGSFHGPSRDSQGSGYDLTKNITSVPKCRDLYNIFHPSDPVSYRLEPLISSAMASLKPQPLPSVKKSLWTTSGQSLSILRDRMGQSVGSMWSNFTSGVASSLLNRSLGLNSEDVSSGKLADGGTGHKGPQAENPDSDEQFHTLIDPDIETLYDGFQRRRSLKRDQRLGEADPVLDSEDQARKMRLEDAKVRALNSNGRVDYSIQEGAFDISLIASIASHLTYWGDEDVNHFMLSQMLSRKSRHRMKYT